MAFDDFGLDIGGAVDALGPTIGGLSSSIPDIPLPDFSAAAGANFFPGETPGTYGAGAPGPGDGSGGGIFGNLSGFAKDALPFLRLGTGVLGAGVGFSALNQAGKQQALLSNAQKTSAAAAAPGVAAAGELIPAGTKALMGGPLPPELEAIVNNFINSEKTKARQTLAKMGLTSSDAATQMDAWIEQQALELRAKLAGGLLQSGTGAIPPGVTGQAGPLASQQTTSINTAVQEAQRAMFNLLGQQG